MMHKNHVVYAVRIGVAVILVALAVILINVALAKQNVGYMCVTVYDGDTDQPLENASVVIPETGEVFSTDKNGKTPMMVLPIIRDNHLSNMLNQDYGTITVLVYKDGFAPYALFFTQLQKGILRTGPNVWLYAEPCRPYVVIESPDEQWANDIIEKFRP